MNKRYESSKRLLGIIVIKSPFTYDREMPLDGSGQWFINVRSAGDPRDGRNHGTYVLLDTPAGAVRFVRV